MNTTRGWRTSAALLVAGAAALTGCSAEGAGGSDDTYKIGMLAALSGPAAQTGQHQRDGAQAAVDAINEAGGVNGRKLKLVVRDDAGNPNTAVSGFNELVRDDAIVGIFGSTFGSATLAVKPLLDRNEIPVIAPNTTHEITNPSSEWLFRNIISAEGEVEAAVELARENGIEKIAVLHSTDAYGSQGGDLLKNSGLDVVAVEEMESDATDVTTQLTKIKAAKPDALFLWAITPGAGLALKNAGQVGLDVPIISGVAGPTAGNITAAGQSSALSRWLNVGLIDPENPLPRQEEAIENLKAAQPDYAPDVYSVTGYSGIELFAEALEAAGEDADRSAIRDAIESIQGLDTVSGVYSFAADNHDGAGIDSVVWLAVENDTYVRTDDPAALLR